MPAERTTMRRVREVLRLKFVGGVPIREIARRIGVAASTVRAMLKRFQATGLSWPLPEELTDAALEARLFPDAGTKQGRRRQVEPDWTAIHRELKRKHVTLSILWDEYIERHPQGYRYSRFCEQHPLLFFGQQCPSQPHVDRNCLGHGATWPKRRGQVPPSREPVLDNKGGAALRGSGFSRTAAGGRRPDLEHFRIIQGLAPTLVCGFAWARLRDH
jgi:transposase-like protein